MAKNILITGGAGFIGSNCAKYYIEKWDNVFIFDNLSRKGTKKNIDWLKEIGAFHFYKGDVSKIYQLEQFFNDGIIPDCIFHFAGQVAVTLSIKDPRHDLINNIIGTYNVLEMARRYAPESILLFSSTNKVYGNLDNSNLEEKETCYELKDVKSGFSENTLLDFHSPYGCSKGAADQYVKDSYKTYNLKTIVFRQSCTYGCRQFGIEDQGWVAWFIISALKDREITIYGNGKQVRDLRFIDDLISAFNLSIANIGKTAGEVYNIGGGPGNQISLLDFVNMLESLLNKKIKYHFSDWRVGDQLIYVSDTSKAEKDFGWRPSINIQEGVSNLIEWVNRNFYLFD